AERLLAADDEAVAVAVRARLQRRRVGARLGLGDRHRQPQRAVHDARDQPLALLVGAVRDERPQPPEVRLKQATRSVLARPSSSETTMSSTAPPDPQSGSSRPIPYQPIDAIRSNTSRGY